MRMRRYVRSGLKCNKDASNKIRYLEPNRVIGALVGLGIGTGRDVVSVMGRPRGLRIQLIVPAVPESSHF
jgi:hypothetical protein